MMNRRFIQFRGSTVSYQIFGEGEAIMFLHGFGEDGNIWINQINYFSRNFRLIIPDIPGSGYSPIMPFNSSTLTLADYAAAMYAILQAENITQISLVGHSMGGYIALEMARLYESVIHKFCMFHSTAFADSEEKIKLRLRSIDFVKRFGAAMFLKESIQANYSAGWKEKNMDQLKDITAIIERFSDLAIIQYYQIIIQRKDQTNLLRAFKKPILFIIGVHDNAVPLADSLQQCHLPPHSFVTILQNSAHSGMWEEPEKSNQALLNFLLHP